MPPPEDERRNDRGETLEPAGELLSLVYEELRRLARGQLRGRARGATVQTTALVHEAWLKIAGDKPELELSRTHFLALAATAMRQVLANHAEKHAAAKRGGGWNKVTLGEAAAPKSGDEVDLVAVSEALEELWTFNERHGRLAELRLLSGMTMQECADVLDSSLSTVERDWRTVRAWFGARLGRSA